jgi:hypothetical protein
MKPSHLFYGCRKIHSFSTSRGSTSCGCLPRSVDHDGFRPSKSGSPFLWDSDATDELTTPTRLLPTRFSAMERNPHSSFASSPRFECLSQRLLLQIANRGVFTIALLQLSLMRVTLAFLPVVVGRYPHRPSLWPVLQSLRTLGRCIVSTRAPTDTGPSKTRQLQVKCA